jgi:hypothetical protein
MMRATRIFALRLIVSAMMAVPVYVVGFQLFVCDDSPGCAALRGSDIWETLLGRPIYPNFLVADERLNIPWVLSPAPSWIHIGLPALAIALALEVISRIRARQISN